MKPSPLSSALALACSAALLSPSAQAGVTVTVTVHGTVVDNQVGPAPIGNANPGDDATLTFEVDSDVFTNSASFPTRGYRIDSSTCVLTMGAAVVGLQSPFPVGQTPYFVLRNDDPAVDGFFISTSVDNPFGLPLEQTGVFGQFIDNFSVTYGGSTLSSLGILGALGTYDFTGLTVFNWTIDDGPFNPVIIDFVSMTIACGPTASVSYCTAGSSASGCQALLSTSGTASSSAPTGFTLDAADVEGAKDGLFFFAANGRQSNPWGNGTSYQCVTPPVMRGALQSGTGTSGLCNGSFSYDLNARWTAKPNQDPGPGALVQAQLWYRDPFNTSNQTTSLSDAVEFIVCP